jgi:hypothetical protein
VARWRPLPWRRSAGAGQSQAPGVKTTRAWVGCDPRDTRNLSRAKARHGRGSSDEHDGEGRLEAADSPACMRSRHCGQLRTTTPRAKEPGSKEEAHRRPAARSCGGDARGDRGRAEVGLLQICWSPKSKHTGPERGAQGVSPARYTPTMRNCCGGATHRRKFPREIPSLPRRRAPMLSPRSFRMARWSFCGGCGGPGRGGTVVRR